MRLRKKIIIVFGVLVLFTVEIKSQNIPSSPINTVPPSPNASSLGKYGETPVSLYTGVPNISIPLFEVKSGSLTLPISLSYHASGIKVEDEASWVGLGWSLFSGGVITRSIRGLDDLRLDTNMSYFLGYPDYKFPTSIEQHNLDPIGYYSNSEAAFLSEVNGNLKDTEPDVFYFNFAGYSGRFYIEQRLSVNEPYSFIIESQEKILIKLERKSGALSGWKWLFITPDGVKYYFETEERIQTTSGGSEREVAPKPENFPLNAGPSSLSISSWYLDKIVSQKGDEILLNYTSGSWGSKKIMSLNESRNHLLSWQSSGFCPGNNVFSEANKHFYYNSLSIVYDVYLKEIVFKNGKLKFETSDRDDIQAVSPNHSKPQRLDRIKLFSTLSNEELVKEYNLNYSYFNYEGPGSGHNMSYPTTYTGKRLKLLSATEKAADKIKPPYEFEYIKVDYSLGDIPDKYSKSKDYWGYFNGKVNISVLDNLSSTGFTSTLIPPYLDKSTNVFYNGASREVDENFAQIGTLKKIKYPTGGTTSFEYESNDYSQYAPPKKKEITEYISLQSVGSDVPANEESIDSSLVAKQAISLSSTTVYDVTLSGQLSTIVCQQLQNEVSGGGYVGFTFTPTGSTPSSNIRRLLIDNILCSDFPSSKFQIISVPPGTYNISISAGSYSIANVLLSYKKEVEDESGYIYIEKGGGLRIAKIVDYNGFRHDGDVIKIYKYHYFDNKGIEKSSGIQMTPVVNEFVHKKIFYEQCNDSNGNRYDNATQTTVLTRTSESNVTLGTSAQGNNIGYSFVTVLNGENGENGKTEYRYMNSSEEQLYFVLPNMPALRRPENGLLTSETQYKFSQNSFEMVKDKLFEYEMDENQSRSLKGFKYRDCEDLLYAQTHGLPIAPTIQFYDNISQWWHPKSTSETIYDTNGNNPVTIYTEFFYDNPMHKQLTRKEKSTSDGKTISVRTFYPDDISSVNSLIPNLSTTEKATIDKLKETGLHRITEPLQVESTIKDSIGTVIACSIQRTNYKEWMTNLVEPEYLKGLKGIVSSSSPMDNQIIFHNYDDKGNPLEVSKAEGMHTVYIWGYNQQYPIAKIDNVAFNEISSYIANLQNLSNTGTEADLITSLNTLRANLPNSMVTTYTYIPLVGISTITDPKGDKTTYTYDSFGRLEFVKDKDNNLLSENQYNYKQ